MDAACPPQLQGRGRAAAEKSGHDQSVIVQIESAPLILAEANGAWGEPVMLSECDKK